MANILVQSPFEFFTDATGRPLSSGYIYVGLPDLDPMQFPQPVYFDADGLVAAPNPVRTNIAGYPADSAGNPQRIYVPANYSIKVLDSNQNQVLFNLNAADGFYGVVAADLANNTDPNKGSDLVGYILQTGASGTTVHDKIARTLVDVKDFGAVGNGTTNDKAAFDAAAASGRAILLPAGNYNVPTGDYSTVRFYSWDGATCTNGTVAIVDPLANSLAVGTEATFPCTPANLPFGWLEENGASLSRTVYPQLWAFANASGNIVDEAAKSANPGAFGRGNGTTTFSLPDKRGTNQGYADNSRALDATFVIGKLVTVTAASAAPGISVRSTISTPAIRAFAQPVNQGTIDIQALQLAVNGKAELIQGANAFVAFNGSGGLSVLGSYNISSVVKNATGDYTINFSVPMVNTGYAVGGMTSGGPTTGASGVTTLTEYPGAKLVGSYRVQTSIVNSGFASQLADQSSISLTFLGGK